MPSRGHVRGTRGTVLGVLLLAVAAGCDSMPLLAPTDSTISVSASSQVVPLGGSTQVTALVIEPSGTPVHNGTTVRFSTDLGQMQPVEAETTDGLATATFLAGSLSGVAQIRATSGGAAGTAGDGDTLASNVVHIVVGAAAVESVILGANPSSVPGGGGTVELLATVVSAAGQLLEGIAVTFVASQGQLASPVVLTDAAGQARTQLTTTQETTVTATAGAVTSSAVTVPVVSAPVVTATIIAADNGVTQPIGHQWTFTAQVTGGTGAPQPTTFAWDFGDGISTTTNGNVTSHVYGASTENTARIVRVTITLNDGSTIVTTTEILIGDIVP